MSNTVRRKSHASLADVVMEHMEYMRKYRSQFGLVKLKYRRSTRRNSNYSTVKVVIKKKNHKNEHFSRVEPINKYRLSYKRSLKRKFFRNSCISHNKKGVDSPKSILCPDVASIFQSKSTIEFPTFLDKEKHRQLSQVSIPQITSCKSEKRVNETYSIEDYSVLENVSLYFQKINLYEHRRYSVDMFGDFNHNIYQESFFKQLIESTSDSNSCQEFTKMLFSFIANTTLCIFFLSVLLLMPCGMVFIGVKNLNECPKEPKIPIYLLVGGCVGFVKLLQTLWILWRKIRKQKFEQGDLVDLETYELESYIVGGRRSRTVNLSNESVFMDVLFNGFLFTWFCFGNYWVFKIWKPNFEQPMYGTDNWCGRTVYMFAFIHIFICYAIILLTLLVVVALLCYTRLHKAFNSTSNSDTLLHDSYNSIQIQTNRPTN